MVPNTILHFRVDNIVCSIIPVLFYKVKRNQLQRTKGLPTLYEKSSKAEKRAYLQDEGSTISIKAFMRYYSYILWTHFVTG